MTYRAQSDEKFCPTSTALQQGKARSLKRALLGNKRLDTQAFGAQLLFLKRKVLLVTNSQHDNSSKLCGAQN